MFSVCPGEGGVPPARSRQGVTRVPPLGQVRTGRYPCRAEVPGYPLGPGQDRGTPTGGTWVLPGPGQGVPGYPPPGTGQHMEYLISGGQYASCVHAGGLSCFMLHSLTSCIFLENQ